MRPYIGMGQTHGTAQNGRHVGLPLQEIVIKGYIKSENDNNHIVGLF
jgi:hypothetical protein